MRLIDADALIEEAETVLDEHKTMWFDAVSVSNIRSAPSIATKQIKYFDEDEKVWKIGSVIVDE